MEKPKMKVYYEGGSLNRFWIAPAGLSLTDAKRVSKKASRYYKTRQGADNKYAEMVRKGECQ